MLYQLTEETGGGETGKGTRTPCGGGWPEPPTVQMRPRYGASVPQGKERSRRDLPGERRV